MSEDNGAKKLLHQVYFGCVRVAPNNIYSSFSISSLSEVDVGLEELIKKEYHSDKRVALRPD